MQLQSQQLSLPVCNYDSSCTPSPFTRHSSLFGGSCKRILLSGPSGSGKTNTLLTLLLHPNGFRFRNIYICSKSLYQDKYAYLKRILEGVPEIGYYEFTDVHNMITPDKVPNYSVVVFDDIPPVDLQLVKQYFSFGRHRNLDVFYLTQTYSSVPKQNLRDNLNLLVLFRQDGTNLKHIFSDHVHDLKYDQFISMCQRCWEEPYGMLVIDRDCNFNEGRYRSGFDTFIRM